jgi:hypothetical protein
VAQSASTFSDVNASPKVGPVVISEIHYHPADFSGGADNSDDEFVELRNLTGAGISLFDPAYPTNTWHLRGTVDFDFPQNVTLGANGFLLLVNFSPADTARLAAFRSKFGVPGAVPVFGPYSGKLDNSSGDVKLSKPDAPLAGETPYILVDEVDYTDDLPWPRDADGDGPSLQRLVSANYGNDPINWIAATPGAGRATAGGTAPVITSQPASRTELGSVPATFSVGVSGAAPFQYQWHYNGANIPGATSSAFTVNYVLPENAGLYSVTVFNGAGSVKSSNALLSVILGPYFTQNPTNFFVRPGNTATFTAAAFGNPPVTYQWRFNGGPAPGTGTSTSSNTMLTITNAQTIHAGTYTALASDNVGAVPSTPATLTLLFDPLITQQPLSQSVVTGATVTLSVSVTNTATLPIGYRWRSNNVSIPGGMIILNQFTNFFIITNVRAPFTNYSVSVTNASRPGGIISAAAFLRLLADSDGDGIPDEWETRFGLASGDPSDRDLDSDLDGMSNWAEYIAGTDPTDELSYLKVDALIGGSGAAISFGAVSNRTYTIQFADDLESGQWFKLGDVVARATNRVENISDPNFVTNRYYRVATPRQP